MVTKNFKESQWIRKIPIRRHFLANYDGTLFKNMIYCIFSELSKTLCMH